MLSPPESKLGKLLQQYVCARVVSLKGIDIAQWEFDPHNAIYFFMAHANGQIYMRYGGRDTASAKTYLDLNSLQLALQQGLADHARFVAGGAKQGPRKKPLFPRDLPNLKRDIIDNNRCVECHQVGDYAAQLLEEQGRLDKRLQMFRSPDIKHLGIYLRVPEGLVVQEAKGAAAEAGVLPGDRITRLGDDRVVTFGDLQFRLDRVSRDAKRIGLTVQRSGESRTLQLDLPPLWWVTDLTWRHWSIEPRLYIDVVPLSAEEKQKLGLAPDGFASRVSAIRPTAKMLKLHDLAEGDVIVAVDGQQKAPPIEDCLLYVRLHVTAGDSTRLTILRDGKRQEVEARTNREAFRKPRAGRD